nr:hypothetical protein [Kibdelosporangium sp. MJ126-NF4]CEL22127.1 hypothetical protein [Kibdelosporangium sp. MJ126-NF4]CTQ92908.1 hypothetical protein [Kibdelosporangium sp. MJ126-NF4]
MKKITGSVAKLLLAVVAMLGLTLVGNQTASAASAAPASIGTETADSVAATFRCNPPTYYRNAVVRTCTVYSGQIRQFIRCSNGRTYYGPWVGRGTWRLTNVCPSPYYRTGSGLQGR